MSSGVVSGIWCMCVCVFFTPLTGFLPRLGMADGSYSLPRSVFPMIPSVRVCVCALVGCGVVWCGVVWAVVWCIVWCEVRVLEVCGSMWVSWCVWSRVGSVCVCVCVSTSLHTSQRDAFGPIPERAATFSRFTNLALSSFVTASGPMGLLMSNMGEVHHTHDTRAHIHAHALRTTHYALRIRSHAHVTYSHTTLTDNVFTYIPAHPLCVRL